jgi:hypothetical protein
LKERNKINKTSILHKMSKVYFEIFLKMKLTLFDIKHKYLFSYIKQGNEPFETELYRPDRQPVPETLASENERTYPTTLPEQPGARTVPRVHYEEKEDVRTNRDGMIGDRNDPGRPSGRRHGWINDRSWQQGDRFMVK